MYLPFQMQQGLGFGGFGMQWGMQQQHGYNNMAYMAQQGFPQQPYPPQGYPNQ